MTLDDTEPLTPDTACDRTEQALAFVCGEMSDTEKSAFSSHSSACPVCRDLVSGYGSVLARLREAPSVSPAQDLSTRVARQIPDAAWRSRSALPLLMFPVRLAACFAVAALGTWLGHRALTGHADRANADTRPPIRVEPAPAGSAGALACAADWLVTIQDPSGGWDVGRWDGRKQYEVGLTGVAVLALLRQDDRNISDAAARGIERILGTQSPEGHFGPAEEGLMYNHGIATVALLEAYTRSPDISWKPAIERAVDFVTRSQLPSGGWGYWTEPGDRPNTSISAWQIQALSLARACGVRDTSPDINRAVKWLAGVVDEQGKFGYREPLDFPSGSRTLTAMGAFCLFTAGEDRGELMRIERRIRAALSSATADPGPEPDFYRWYFMTAALEAGGGDFDHLRRDVQQTVLRHRAVTGPHAGTWDPVDPWSAAGGRIYSTAMAVLSLQAGT